MAHMNLDRNFLSGLSPLMTELCLLKSSNGVSVGLGYGIDVDMLDETRIPEIDRLPEVIPKRSGYRCPLSNPLLLS